MKKPGTDRAFCVLGPKRFLCPTISAMKRKTVYVLLTLLCTVGFWYYDTYYERPQYGEEVPPHTQETATDWWPSSTDGEVVQHPYYALSYRETFEQAEWVAYTLNRSQLTHDDRKRPYFIEDPQVPTFSADWRNYKGSGYDRGHLCPAGDRRFSKDAYDQTFYTSNIAPQRNVFNAGIWNQLEIQVRDWAHKYGALYVVTGGILQEGLPTIGEEKVAVPQYFYKIVARKEGQEWKCIAFLMPNQEGHEPLGKYEISVDEVEKRTHIDFFAGLPTSVQDGMEKAVKASEWPL